MVILNATCGLILKAPVASISIFDLVYVLKSFLKNGLFELIFEKTCSYYETCYTFEKFSNLLFLLSLSLYFIFYYNFDKKFQASFKRIVKNKSSESNENKPAVNRLVFNKIE